MKRTAKGKTGREKGMVPYGYQIVEGRAVPDPVDAGKLRTMYALYLEGSAINEAASSAGVPRTNSSAGALLSDRVYLGTDFYPRLIQDEVFEKVQEERKRRAGAARKVTVQYRAVPVRTAFRLKETDKMELRGGAADFTASIYNLIEPDEGNAPSDAYSPKADAKTERQIQALYDWHRQHPE